jgi:hypothetical protein
MSIVIDKIRETNEGRALGVLPHHFAGSSVLVTVEVQPRRVMQGEVECFTASGADDVVPYRLNVRGVGEAAGRYWPGCSPEWVAPMPLEAA